MISDGKILVTGASGTIAQHLATRLASDNEVWGIARFAGELDGRGGTAPATPGVEPGLPRAGRSELEAAGVITRAVDLGDADLASALSELPTDFTHVLHLAWTRAGIDELDAALRINVEAAGLVLHHCRRARAALVMSGMGVYSPHDDAWHRYAETDPVGRSATAYAPTSPACKLGLESVARYCARAFDLPVVITRLNTFMGTPASFPALHLQAVLDGRSLVAPHDPCPHSPIHLDDMHDQLDALLDAAAVPALVTNWCGDEVVTAQSWVEAAAAWSGRPGRLDVVPATPKGAAADPARRRSLTGPCRTRFDEALEALYRSLTSEEPA